MSLFTPLSCASFDPTASDPAASSGIEHAADSGSDGGGETDSPTEPDTTSADSDTGSEADTVSDAAGRADVSGDLDAGGGADLDTGTDTDTDTDTEADTYIDTDTDTGTDVDVGGDSDSDSADTEMVCGVTITTCIDDDGCCPSVCSTSSDNDCYTSFDYAPSNFDPSMLRVDSAPKQTVLVCEAVFDSSGNTSFDQWCDEEQPPVYIDTSSTPELVILTFVNLKIAQGGSLRLIGDRPVILAVFGNATIYGVIDASASGTTPGAGGNLLCGSSEGGDGTGCIDNWYGASGGGGGGFGTPGGAGGHANTDNYYDVGVESGGSAGGIRGEVDLVPLIGGCAGGQGGDCSFAGGAGGGAVQISAADTLKVNGTVKANGGDGATPCGADVSGGGTGGGSGGGILLEASTWDTAGATLQARGGNGGLNGSFCGVYDAHCGVGSGGSGSTSPDNSGGKGADSDSGGVGGGGGYGRIVTATR